MNLVIYFIHNISILIQNKNYIIFHQIILKWVDLSIDLAIYFSIELQNQNYSCFYILLLSYLKYENIKLRIEKNQFNHLLFINIFNIASMLNHIVNL